MALSHERIEKNAPLLLALTLLTVAVGGLVEIIPLFTIESTIEKVDGVRPWSPLELAGRNIYVREGCYVCHSQQIRPFRDEVERYGHYSIAAESQFDHPFQWGSKRTGPDLARVGGKYSNDWHVAHLSDPEAVVPGSVMPPYAFLADHDLRAATIGDDLAALADLGVPYDAAMIEGAASDLRAQADPNADPTDVQERYPGAIAGDFDGDPTRITEMDALVAYLQTLGTMVRFNELTLQDLQQ